MNTMPRIRKGFAYIRFSRPEQLKGDSLRRQLMLCREYCEKHSITLDDRTMEDLGVSGYRGKNSKEGALSKFLEAMRAREIPRGSFLIVEDLDRISREKHTDALALFLEIVKSGVTIVTTNDSTAYSKDALDADIAAFLKPLLALGTAGKESQKKSERLGHAWQQKRRDIGIKKMTAACPKWLRLSADRSRFEPIPDRVALIRRIFEMSAQGMGRYRIAQQFNREKIPVWERTGTKKGRISRGWQYSYIGRILKNRAVLGEFHPCKSEVVVDENTGTESVVRHIPDGPVVENYYPAIIDVPLFFQVTRKPRKPAGRASGSVANLFPTLMFDGYYDVPMRYCDKGIKKSHHTRNRFIISDARRLFPDEKSVIWKYDDFEKAFLTFVSDIDWTKVLQTGKPEELKSIEIALLTEEASLSEAQRRCSNIAEQIAAGAAQGLQSNTLMSVLVQNESTVAACRERIKSLQKEANRIEATIDSLGSDIDGFRQLATDAENLEIRLRLREEIRSRVERIILFPDGWPVNGHRPKKPNKRGFIVAFRNGCSSFITIAESGGTKIEFAPSGGSLPDPTQPHGEPQQLSEE